MRWMERLVPSLGGFLQEAESLDDYTLFDLLHGYVYGRWPYLYIGVATGEHRLAKLIRPLVQGVLRLIPGPAEPNPATITMADTYHGKVVPPSAARQLVTVQQEIELRDLEQIIPYQKARDIVLKNPDHIVALECPCRASRPDPCLPLDVCLIIGEPFASFVIGHHKTRGRWISQSEAEEILAAEHERGHVHHAFFKDAMLGRFYAICNCCSCCCGAMQAWQGGSQMLASSGYVAQVDPERCAGCGQCEQTCPFEAIHLQDGHAVVTSTACMGCGVCQSLCPAEAISLDRDATRGEPLELNCLVGAIEACD